MFALRLGIVTSLLSETLVSGFTTGAAIYVFTSQIKDVLGISIKSQTGICEVVLVSSICWPIKMHLFFSTFCFPGFDIKSFFLNKPIFFAICVLVP